jgi:D-beta-D-heptose 7-phosphate kinase/D-beta-D-heptose 1-phosphate adenosyltransferase
MDYELPEDEYDALVISDYDKGFLTQKKIFELTQWFDGPVFIDSKKTTLPGDAYIKINEEEFKKITHYNPETLIVTKGGKGAEYKGKLYEGEKVKVYDVVGAGDTFLSALVYFYLLCGTIEKAIPYANKASAIAVQNFGTYVLTEKDVKDLCD